MIKDIGHMAHGMLNLPLEENDELEERGTVRESTKLSLGRGDTICLPNLTMESWAPPSVSYNMNEACMNDKCNVGS